MSSGSEDKVEESDSSYQCSSDGTVSSLEDSDHSDNEDVTTTTDDVVREKVTAWIQFDECGKCLLGKAAMLEHFLLSVAAMAKEEKNDEMKVTADRARQLLLAMEELEAPKINSEKAETMFKQVRPYVPAQYRGDALYAEPTEDQVAAAAAIKKARAARKRALVDVEEKTN